MKISVEKLTEQALALPVSERAALVDRLAESLEPELVEEYRAVWAAEAARRLDEIVSKKVKPIPFGKAVAQVRKSLKG
ncbi:MAG TPA: addiction module protein [Holophaga sp.]|nr:addiction module protein [Holophaga sp.]